MRPYLIAGTERRMFLAALHSAQFHSLQHNPALSDVLTDVLDTYLANLEGACVTATAAVVDHDRYARNLRINEIVVGCRGQN